MKTDEKRQLKACLGHDEGPCVGGPDGGPFMLGPSAKGPRCAGCRLKKYHQDAHAVGVKSNLPPSEEDKPPPLSVMPDWWKNLPVSSDFKADVLWAYNELHNITHRPGKSGVILWGLCSTPPSRAAHSQLSFAESNPKAFQDRVEKITLGGGGDDDANLIREEKKSLKEIQSLLEKMRV